MSQVSITLPDGSVRSVPTGTPVRGVAEEISPNLAKAALAGMVDGKLVDLAYPLAKDASVKIVTDKSPEALALVRHSTAHLLAAAVTHMFPGVQCGIVPATDLSDGTHLNPTGSQKVADRFLAVVLPWFKP